MSTAAPPPAALSKASELCGPAGLNGLAADARSRLPVRPISSMMRRRSAAAILLLLIGVQCFYYTGFVASDDLAYLNCALRGPAALQEESPHFFLRFMHWGPMAAAIRILPDRPWAASAVPMLSMIATLLVIGRLARRMGIERAWLPMTLFGLTPLTVALATTALPDVTGTAMAWLGLALCWPAVLERDQRRSPARCLAGGFLIAMGYNAKETVAILIPSLALFGLLYQTREAWAWKRLALIFAGAALWVGGEGLLFWQWTGDPLFHAHATAQAEHQYGPPEVRMTLAGLWSYGSDYFRWLMDPRSDYGPIGPFLLAGALFVVTRRRERICGLLAWLILPGLLYLSVGSSSLTSYQPLHHQSRHLLPILPGMALAAGLAIDRLWTGRPSWSAGFKIAAVGMILAGLIAPDRLAGQWYFSATYRAGRELIAEHAALHGPGRLHASVFSGNRYRVPDGWLGGPRPAVIVQPPASVEEWIARYGGNYVLTTRLDRLAPRKPGHAGRSLWGPSAKALSRFPVVARREPPRSRLGAVLAGLSGGAGSTNTREAVDIHHIPRSACGHAQTPDMKPNATDPLPAE